MKKLSQETVNKNVDYIVDGIKEVITTFGPRAPGSKGEADAQEYFAKELGKYADEVKTQKFTLHPMAFMGWIYFEVAFMLAALVCLWFNINIASILLGVTAITLAVLQLMLYIHVTAPFFPKKTSSNVYAVKKPTGEVKRRIIFCGHTDAAPEWGALYKGGAGLFETQFISSLLVVAVVIGMAIAGILVNGFTVFPQSINSTPLPYLIALIVVTVICTPIVIWLAFFFNPLRTVDGANDNLTANFTAASILKTMAEENIALENTEVCALMAGSEEAGLRGAMAFAKDFKDELSDVETIIVVMETLRETDCLCVYTRDLNGIVKTDVEVAALVKEACKQATGRDIKFSFVPLGSTDSAAFALAGLKSTCFAGVNHKLQRYYHTRMDSYDNLSRECLEISYKTMMKTLELYDKNGLKTE
ncbi:MAG TPA: M28 family peptidase [Clostridia bacterium]|nr:M28 family peptidase [Clostridia bacterium]HPO53280.1 M28 family peptidase [Clostridia bacterium]